MEAHGAGGESQDPSIHVHSPIGMSVQYFDNSADLAAELQPYGSSSRTVRDCRLYLIHRLTSTRLNKADDVYEAKGCSYIKDQSKLEAFAHRMAD